MLLNCIVNPGKGILSVVELIGRAQYNITLDCFNRVLTVLLEYNNFYIIIRLQNTGIYRIYNPKALGCGTQTKRGYY